MLSLISIRTQYLKRHCCAVYCSYLLIPTLIIFTLLINIMNRLTYEDYNNSYQNEQSIPGKEILSDLNLLDSKINKNFKSISFLVDKQEDCVILKNYINSTQFECEDDEYKLIYKENIVKIINKNGKYDIQFLSKELSYYYSDRIFSSLDFETEKFADPFYPNHYGYLYKENEFFFLQSVLTKFLIKKNGKELKKMLFLM